MELKSGLEIHQQLDTHKLFCRCPSVLRTDNPSLKVSRKLHAVAGETGEVDEAVKHELGKDKEFEYEAYDTTCLVELDESPPELINEEALKIALQVSLLLNCKILRDVQIMRKTVIDGSNTSGFQRTARIAEDGWIDTKDGRVGIDAIYLEEDAARIIKKEKEKTIFRLDRLGIPLMEIATKADIKSPGQAKEAALKIGEVLRACKVKRGLGTIRQDVNMSVKAGKWGARVEIKGFQDIRNIEKTMEIEAKRQEQLIAEGKSIEEVRNALANCETEFLRPMPGKARMYPETDLPLLHISRDFENEIRRSLPKLREELQKELKEKGLNENMISIIFDYGKFEEFNELMKISKKAELIAKMITLWRQEIATKKGKTIDEIEERLTTDILETILQKLQKEQIKEANIKEIMQDIYEGKGLGEVFERKGVDNLEEEIEKIVKEKPGLSANAYMGLVMARFKGKVSGQEVMEILKKLVK